MEAEIRSIGSESRVERAEPVFSYFSYFLSESAGAAAPVVVDFGWIDSSSTSKISVAPGVISGPACRSPYAKSAGINNWYFDPTGISCRASVQPLITPPTGNDAGWPRL